MFIGTKSVPHAIIRIDRFTIILADSISSELKSKSHHGRYSPLFPLLLLLLLLLLPDVAVQKKRTTSAMSVGRVMQIAPHAVMLQCECSSELKRKTLAFVFGLIEYKELFVMVQVMRRILTSKN